MDIDTKYDEPPKIARWTIVMENAYPGEAVMMKGDAIGTFHNIPFYRSAVGQLADYFPKLNMIVVNLALPFGWTDSQI